MLIPRRSSPRNENAQHVLPSDAVLVCVEFYVELLNATSCGINKIDAPQPFGDRESDVMARRDHRWVHKKNQVVPPIRTPHRSWWPELHDGGRRDEGFVQHIFDLESRLNWIAVSAFDQGGYGSMQA